MSVAEPKNELSARALQWASTMDGVRLSSEGVRGAHEEAALSGVFPIFGREEREAAEHAKDLAIRVVAPTGKRISLHAETNSMRNRTR